MSDFWQSSLGIFRAGLKILSWGTDSKIRFVKSVLFTVRLSYDSNKKKQPDQFCSVYHPAAQQVTKFITGTEGGIWPALDSDSSANVAKER